MSEEEKIKYVIQILVSSFKVYYLSQQEDPSTLLMFQKMGILLFF